MSIIGSIINFGYIKIEDMPEKIDKCVKKVMQQGKAKNQAYAICVSSIKPKPKKKK